MPQSGKENEIQPWPHDLERIDVVSAITERSIGSVPERDEHDIDQAVAAARAAVDDPAGWAHWTAGERARIVHACLRKHAT